MFATGLSLLPLLAALSCDGDAREPSILTSVEVSREAMIPSLECPAQVIRTESDVPHIYAHSRADAARALGYVMAQDRFFEIDLARRLGLGKLTELLGQDALDTDIESAASGSRHVAQTVLDNLSGEEAVVFDAFAEGINAYIVQVKRGELPLPSELELAGPLLGLEDPTDAMDVFTREDVAGVAATVVYNLGYETGDMGRQRTEDTLATMFEGSALEELRHEGAYRDLWDRVAPVYAVASAPGFGTTNDNPPPPQDDQAELGPRPPRLSGVPMSVLDRAIERADGMQERLGHDWQRGFGSNAWAVSGDVSADGRALLAGDGHLPLEIPSLFWQVGLDTELLGGEDFNQLGVMIPGLPFMAVGTNGNVAWSQTQIMGDITDWYAEELVLDGDGRPSATMFQGAQQALTAHSEVFEIADVPILGSDGRTLTIERFVTFDGRWIFEIEGVETDEDTAAPSGQTKVNLGGEWILPQDTDGDGVVSAISFDYVGLDELHVMEAINGFGKAADVFEFREATKGLLAYSQNMVAADADGNIFYTGYQAVPCRTYLDRDSDDHWADGAHPGLLLDGTTYGGFTIPVADGVVDESSSDPYECVVPFEEYPQYVNAGSGYVQSTNNDPAGLSFDDSLSNDQHYIGGSWSAGYRANRVDELLNGISTAGTADVATMAEVQGDTKSGFGDQFTPVLLDSIELAWAIDDAGAITDAEARLLELYLADAEALDEVHERLSAWHTAGSPTPSGVETFYNVPADGDAEHAVATMIFNAWFYRFVSGTFDDEGLPNVWQPWGSAGRVRGLTNILDGRGADNPGGLASWNEDTQESAFFDVLGTDEIETSQEVALSAALGALTFLRSEDQGDSEGGFGTEDMDQWLWGLKHVVRFDSILAGFLGDDGTFAALTAPFSITTDTLPLAAGLSGDDPRASLLGFPRAGDQYAVDAANPGFSGTSFDYGSGPVFRMVVALGADGVEGVNVIPGGQSGLTDSDYFSDQAALWLANETVPMRYTAEDVVAGATAREIYWPGAGDASCGL